MKINRTTSILLTILLFVGGCQTRMVAPLETQQLMCKNAHEWAGQVVGDGHCVSLIKLCSGASLTSYWRPGDVVRGKPLTSGTVIATFRGNHYPSKTGYHAAIYIEQDDEGIWVWDQWVGKPVHRRLIRWQTPNGTPANTGNAYRVVLDTQY